MCNCVPFGTFRTSKVRICQIFDLFHPRVTSWKIKISNLLIFLKYAIVYLLVLFAPRISRISRFHGVRKYEFSKLSTISFNNFAMENKNIKCFNIFKISNYGNWYFSHLESTNFPNYRLISFKSYAMENKNTESFNIFKIRASEYTS